MLAAPDWAAHLEKLASAADAATFALAEIEKPVVAVAQDASGRHVLVRPGHRGRVNAIPQRVRRCRRRSRSRTAGVVLKTFGGAFEELAERLEVPRVRR